LEEISTKLREVLEIPEKLDKKGKRGIGYFSRLACVVQRRVGTGEGQGEESQGDVEKKTPSCLAESEFGVRGRVGGAPTRQRPPAQREGVGGVFARKELTSEHRWMSCPQGVEDP